MATTDRFDIGRVFTRTWGVFGANFGPFLILALLFETLPTVILTLAPGELTQHLSQPGQWALGFALGLVQLALAYTVTGALVRGAIVDLDGRKASIGDCVSVGLRNALPAFVIALITAIAALIGLMILIVPGVIIGLAWSVATPVLVVERKGIFGSLARSGELTRGHRWALFGLGVCFILLLFAASIPFGIVGTTLSFATSGSLWIRTVYNAVGSAVISVFGAVLNTATYAELRGSREGVGVSELAAVFD